MSQNQKYGRLTILKEVDKNPSGTIRVLARCDCGKEKTFTRDNITNGSTKSCGCIHRERITKHGMVGTRIYKIWEDMKIRCRTHDSYLRKKITACQKWQDFLGFYEDMKDGYADNLEIDRIDNDKGYYKENCRWATKAVQMNNRDRVLNAKGYTYMHNRRKRYLACIQIDGTRNVIGLYNTKEEAHQAYLAKRQERFLEIGII